MPEYPRSPFKKTGSSITPNIDGDALNATPVGETTPAVGAFTALEATGQLQGALINNQMVQKATFDILGIMTDPRFLNLQCEDPGAGTMTDVSGQGHDGTYQGTMTSGDRVKKGMGWMLDFDGANDYVDLGDHNDFSFGDGTNDESVTWFGVVEVLNASASRVLMSKWDDTSGSELREWFVYIDTNENLTVMLRDESAAARAYTYTNTSLSLGFHSYAITYDGAGGASASDTIKTYIDGSIVSSTGSTDVGYVAMENLTPSCLIGALKITGGVPGNFIDSDSALVGMDGAEWSAFDVFRFHQLCKGLYAL